MVDKSRIHDFGGLTLRVKEIQTGYNKPSSGQTTGISVSGTTGLGYVTGTGGTVTQATSKSTGVTLNKLVGQITMNNAALAAAAVVSFTLTNSLIGTNDLIVVNVDSGGTAKSYTAQCVGVGAGSCDISVTNTTAGSLGEAVVISFMVLKGAIA